MKFTLFALLTLNLLIQTRIYATTFTLNTFIDGNDIIPGDGLCQDASGNCGLRTAIQEANSTAGPDQIILSVGTYLLTLAGTNEDGCQRGDLDITSEISIIGIDAWTCIIDGNQLDRVFHISPLGRLDIQQLTIMNGFLSEGTGAGLLNQGNLTLNFCCLVSNLCQSNQGLTQIGGLGGGIANYQTLTINNSTLQNNVARGTIGSNGHKGGGGGGSTPGLGGGLYNDNLGNATLINCTFSGNRALGGWSSVGATNGGTHNFAGSRGAGPIPGNGGSSGGGAGSVGGDFSGGGGGGSSCGTGGNGGSGGYGAGGGGRGARSCGGGNGNAGVAGFGGGPGNRSCCSSSGGGGAGAGMGGALFVNSGNVTLVSCTVAFNQALGGYGRSGQGGYAARGLRGSGLGGGIFNRNGTVSMNNTLLSNNVGNMQNNLSQPISNAQNDLFGTFTSTDGHNLVMSPGAAVMGGNTSNNLLNQDPQLLPLSNNGGANNTHETDPCAPSIVINAGFASMSLDQRGSAQVAQADIGAFEQQNPCIVLSEQGILLEGSLENKFNKIKWADLTEGSFDKFELYSSQNGYHWQLIEAQSAHITSNVFYECLDNKPNLAIAYYRLKCYQDNQVVAYSQTIALERDNEGANFVLAPNPFVDELTIAWQSAWVGNALVEISDYKGSLLYQKEHKTEQKNIKIALGNKIPKGLYLIRLTFDEQVFVRKIIKQ